MNRRGWREAYYSVTPGLKNTQFNGMDKQDTNTTSRHIQSIIPLSKCRAHRPRRSIYDGDEGEVKGGEGKSGVGESKSGGGRGGGRTRPGATRHGGTGRDARNSRGTRPEHLSEQEVHLRAVQRDSGW